MKGKTEEGIAQMSPPNNLTGKTLNNRYEILRPLGEGGMGKVYLAKDKRFGKQVVVKVPTMEAGDKDFKDRFMREIASLAKLEHAHIVPTMDWGEVEGVPYLVLRYLSGGSLRNRITDGNGFYKPMPIEGLAQWLPQIASALDFIHSKGWVHRDLKPDNILFDESGSPYLADFGIAKALEGNAMGVKTTTGMFIGTPQYMAPEMHLGKGIGPKADQFGLAVLVYEALAGKIPFEGATPTAIFVEILQGKAKPIHEVVQGISLEKSEVLMRAMSKDPKARHGSCTEFASALLGGDKGILARELAGKGEKTPPSVPIPPTRVSTPAPMAIPLTRKEPAPKKPGIEPTRLPTPQKQHIQSTRIEAKSNEGPRNPTKVKSDIPATITRKENNETEADAFMDFADVILKNNSHVNFTPENSAPFDDHVSTNQIPLYLVLFFGIIGVFGLFFYLTIRHANLQADSKKEEIAREQEENAKSEQEQEANARRMELARLNQVEAQEKEMRIELAKLKQTEELKFQSIEKTMVLIPVDKFLMGSPESEKGRSIVGETQHEVTLTKPYYLGKYEVTQEQWQAVMGKNPSNSERAKLPVTNVSWEDCQDFIAKLNAKTNGGYRLPTEAEWEYACRAGTTTAFSFGGSITKNDASFDGTSLKVGGSYKPNAFGLYDMHGNVWEWCNDWYASSQNGRAVTDPTGPATGTFRVLRGGSFLFNESLVRSSNRGSLCMPSYRNIDLGFRLARTADIKASASPTPPKTGSTVVIPDSKPIENLNTKLNSKEIFTLNNYGTISPFGDPRSGAGVTSVSFSPDGKWIASGSFDNTIKVWDASTGKIFTTLHGHSGIVRNVCFSPDEKLIASGSIDNTIKIWNGPNFSSERVFTIGKKHEEPVVLKGGVPVDPLSIPGFKSGSNSVNSVAFGSKPRGFIVSGDYNGNIKLWRLNLLNKENPASEILTIKLTPGTVSYGHFGQVNSVSLNPDQTLIVSGGEDKTVKVWDPFAKSHKKEIFTLQGHSSEVTCAMFSPDGKRIVSGSYDKTLKVWEAGTGKEIFTLKGHNRGVTSASFSPDGKWLASGSTDDTIKIWDASDGREILTPKGHTSGVTSVSFSPDGKRIVSGSYDKTLKVWEIWRTN